MGRTSSDRRVGHLDSLDGIRALAIASVFLLHVDRAHFPGGFLGVDMFFVLSAFLITSILLRERERRGSVQYGAFYWRRFFRLGPALVLWLVCIAAPTALLIHQGAKIPISTAGALFYVNDFLQAWTNHVGTSYDQSWSLAVEEQFYLVWPFVFALVAARFTRIGLGRAMVGFVGLSVVIYLTIGNYFLPTGHIEALALGCWAACWSVQSREDSRLTPWLRDTRVAVVTLPVLGLALLVDPTGGTGDALALLVAVATTVLLLHCTLNARSMLSRVLASPVPRWIGVRSYGIYLYGLTLLIMIPTVTHLRLHEALPLDVVVIAAVVALSFRFVEYPIRTRGRAWLERRGEVESSDAELGLQGMAEQDGGPT